MSHLISHRPIGIIGINPTRRLRFPIAFLLFEQFHALAFCASSTQSTPSTTPSTSSSTFSALRRSPLTSSSSTIPKMFSNYNRNFEYEYSSITTLGQLTNNKKNNPSKLSPSSSSPTSSLTSQSASRGTSQSKASLQSFILSKTIPPLTSKSHKGSSGRLGIVGGSAKYTGAPYYTAMSALRTGCDLVTIYCANEATIPIKSYSPELMVEGVYSASEFNKIVQEEGEVGGGEQQEWNDKQINEMVQKVSCNLDRYHALIIGPGLGRCPLVLKATSIILQKAITEYDLNIVLDADGLYLLSLTEHWDLIQNCLMMKKKSSTFKSKSKIVLTPNVVEYKRLVDSMGEGSEDILRSKLSGVTMIRKGHEDIIEYIPRSYKNSDDDDDEVEQEFRMTCSEQGGLKRSGGLGKFFFLAWR